MSTINMFEQATRAKLRFQATNGYLNVEDLWDLPLTAKTGTRANLDDLAKSLHRQLKNDDNISFVKPATPANTELQLGFELVKYIIEVKIAERDAANAAATKAEKKQQIMALIAQKKQEALAGQSVEELEAQLAALVESV